MNIRSIKHRGLRRFIENNDLREIRGDLVIRTRNIFSALITASDMAGVQVREIVPYLLALTLKWLQTGYSLIQI